MSESKKVMERMTAWCNLNESLKASKDGKQMLMTIKDWLDLQVKELEGRGIKAEIRKNAKDQYAVFVEREERTKWLKYTSPMNMNRFKTEGKENGQEEEVAG